jgi:hypothetical protein
MLWLLLVLCLAALYLLWRFVRRSQARAWGWDERTGRWPSRDDDEEDV